MAWTSPSSNKKSEKKREKRRRRHLEGGYIEEVELGGVESSYLFIYVFLIDRLCVCVCVCVEVVAVVCVYVCGWVRIYAAVLCHVHFCRLRVEGRRMKGIKRRGERVEGEGISLSFPSLCCEARKEASWKQCWAGEEKRAPGG
jgi:hypothetical protein